MTPGKLIVHGLDLSYFTGKLEAYLRAKGIDYELREMTTGSFRACGKATGFLQMPQVEMPDGLWLTDSSLIIRYFEEKSASPEITPKDPSTRFISRLVEDFGDETLWRPALYYRWAFADDARLMSGRLARGMLRDLPLPFFIRRQIILRRQQSVYLKKDGVTPSNSAAIEALYGEVLAAMEQALSAHPFVMGARPTDADFGLFGSMFRHFFSDPTPAKIMRERAPKTLAWVARLWALTPADCASEAVIETVPASLAGLLRLVVKSHLPYLAANAKVVADGSSSVSFVDYGAEFSVPASPYRAWCLAELQREFQALSTDAQTTVGLLLGDANAINLLTQPPQASAFAPPNLPITPAATPHQLRDRSWV